MATTKTKINVEDIQAGDYFFHWGSWYLTLGRARKIREDEMAPGFREVKYRVPAINTAGSATDALIYGDEIERADERPPSFNPSYLRRKANNHRDAARERMNQAKAIEDLAALVAVEGAGKR